MISVETALGSRLRARAHVVGNPANQDGAAQSTPNRPNAAMTAHRGRPQDPNWTTSTASTLSWLFPHLGTVVHDESRVSSHSPPHYPLTLSHNGPFPPGPHPGSDIARIIPWCRGFRSGSSQDQSGIRWCTMRGLYKDRQVLGGRGTCSYRSRKKEVTIVGIMAIFTGLLAFHVLFARWVPPETSEEKTGRLKVFAQRLGQHWPPCV